MYVGLYKINNTSPSKFNSLYLTKCRVAFGLKLARQKFHELVDSYEKSIFQITIHFSLVFPLSTKRILPDLTMSHTAGVTIFPVCGHVTICERGTRNLWGTNLIHPLGRDVNDTLIALKRQLTTDSDSNSLLVVIVGLSQSKIISTISSFSSGNQNNHT